MTRSPGRSMLGALLGIAIAACVSIPAFRGDAGSGDGGLGDGGVDSGVPPLVNYTITFSGAGARYPDKLLIEGIDMLGPGSTCNDEHFVGVANSPAFRLDRASGTAVFDEVIPAGGPLDVWKVTTRWNQPHKCDGGRIMTGRSTFTMFPDGRITRFDHVGQGSGDSNAYPPVEACSCGAATQSWYVTSYVALTGITAIDLPNNIQLTPGSDDVGSPLPGQIACARNATGQRVAFGMPLSPSARVRAMESGSTAFVLDMVAPSPTQRDISFAPEVYKTYILLGGTGGTCDELNDRLDELVKTGNPQVAIAINGVHVTYIGPADVDGIFGGEQYSSLDNVGYPIPNTAAIELSTPSSIPAGWAVWFSYEAGRPGAYTVTSNAPLAASDYHIQPLADGTTLIVWFRQRLDPGTIITLTPT